MSNTNYPSALIGLVPTWVKTTHSELLRKRMSDFNKKKWVKRQQRKVTSLQWIRSVGRHTSAHTRSWEFETTGNKMKHSVNFHFPLWFVFFMTISSISWFVTLLPIAHIRLLYGIIQCLADWRLKPVPNESKSSPPVFVLLVFPSSYMVRSAILLYDTAAAAARSAMNDAIFE